MLAPFASPFQLGFYNTTPNAFTLAIRIGLVRSESLMCWVWEANRGNPVGENATFSLGTDGNLVLDHVDGRVAWQTNTANKGVIGFRFLPNGNMVLYDSKGSFVWQSFDYPTDTLLVGHSLRVGEANKLVSRASRQENKDGPYSLALNTKGLCLYYKSGNTLKQLPYSELFTIWKGSMEYAILESTTNDGYPWEITLTTSGGIIHLDRPKFNATLMSYLRVAIDGNLQLYTYDAKIDSWEHPFTLFDRQSIRKPNASCQSKYTALAFARTTNEYISRRLRDFWAGARPVRLRS